MNQTYERLRYIEVNDMIYTWSSLKLLSNWIPVLSTVLFNKLSKLFILSRSPVASGTSLIRVFTCWRILHGMKKRDGYCGWRLRVGILWWREILNIKQRKEKWGRRYISGGRRGWFRVVDGKSLLLSSHDRLCPVNMFLNRDLIKILFAFNKKNKKNENSYCRSFSNSLNYYINHFTTLIIKSTCLVTL